MVSARLTPQAKAALIRQHLDDGVPLTRLAAAAGLPARTLRRWSASYHADPTASARGPSHDGDAAYRNHFELVHRCTAARPNEQWQADHNLLDLQVLDVKQQPAWPCLTIVLDDYSAGRQGNESSSRC